jgi:hypothetical protein
VNLNTDPSFFVMYMALLHLVSMVTH